MPDFLNAVVDVSHWDRDVDFQAVAGSGVLGIMQKATQGQLDIDPTYAGNRIKATQAGLLWGAYHFAPATRVSARRSIFSQSSAIIAMYCWRSISNRIQPPPAWTSNRRGLLSRMYTRRPDAIPAFMAAPI